MPIETQPHESSPRWQRRKETRPAELIESAFEEFVTRGFAATRLEDIAKRAGCTKGTIFLYFPSKEELFKEMVRQVMLPYLAEAEQVVEHHQGTMRDLLADLLRRRFERMMNSKLSGVLKLVFAEVGHFPDIARFYHDEIISRSHRMISSVLQRGVELGEFRAHDTANVARMAVAPLMLAALWRHTFAPHTDQAIDPNAYFEASLEVLLRGIASDPAAGDSHV